LGEWLKKTTVRSQDQRRMLQATTYTFPSNYWRHKITKKKESDRCDLCKALWIAEGRFTTVITFITQSLILNIPMTRRPGLVSTGRRWPASATASI
jgi:hypothetical protein